MTYPTFDYVLRAIESGQALLYALGLLEDTVVAVGQYPQRLGAHGLHFSIGNKEPCQRYKEHQLRLFHLRIEDK